MNNDIDRLKFILGNEASKCMLAKIKLCCEKDYDIVVLPENSIITLDYRIERLRICVDKNNIIKSYSIG